MDFDYNRLYLTTDGRIGRQDFWMGILGFVVAGIVLSVLIWLLAGSTSFFARLLNFIVQVAFAYPSYALMAKRFQDRAKPGIYGAILPAAGLLSGLFTLFGITNPMAPGFLDTIIGLALLGVVIWILVELGILRGTVGPNEYGPDPVAP